MIPSASAQIHVPHLAPPLPFRVRSAVIVARRRFGVVLIFGAMLLGATTVMTEGRSSLPVMVGTWLAATLVGVLTAARAGAWRTHEAPSARLSWGFLFAGLALMGPLTLHAFMQTWLWAPNIFTSIGGRSFGSWVLTSLWFTGPSHVVFAALCFVRGFRGDGKPNLLLIGVIVTVVTGVVDCVLWSVYGLLPAAYVAFTAALILFGLKRVERMHEE
jgi:hypothetical protein